MGTAALHQKGPTQAEPTTAPTKPAGGRMSATVKPPGIYRPSQVPVTQPTDGIERAADAGAAQRRRSPFSFAPSRVWHALETPGRPLRADERPAGSGVDLSSVRVHDGVEATESAAALAASAYTVGDDIVVGNGYQPGSARGQALLAHELRHVAQARREGSLVLARQGTDEPEPVEAGSRFDTTHLLGNFHYTLDPVKPLEVGQPPGASSLFNTSQINPSGTWTLALGGSGAQGQPAAVGQSIATSPLDWLQITAGVTGPQGPQSVPGIGRSANLQAQVAPSDTQRVNPALIAGVGASTLQQPGAAPDTLTPNAFATLVLESLIGGADAAHSRFSAAASVSLLRTPYLNGVLGDVTGATVGGGLTLFSDYYRDAPPATPGAAPAGQTQTPRLSGGVAAAYSFAQGRPLAPGGPAMVSNWGVDIFATYVSPMQNVLGSRGRWFISLTPGVRGSGAGVGFSGTVTIGWLSAGPPGGPLGPTPEHP